MDTSSQPLSLALRTTTATAHESAERSSFISELMEGRACYSAFVALAAQQLVIYQALEEVLAQHYRGHRLLAPVDDRRLDRVAALEHDLSVLVGDDYEVRLADGSLSLCPATVAYAQELRERHTPEVILANHYVRYLGDLSGGQVIATLAARHYDVPQEGLTFYRFPGIDKLKPYKDDYRAALDSIEMTPQERERTLDAALRAFQLNESVFAALGEARAPRHAAAGVQG